MATKVSTARVLYPENALRDQAAPTRHRMPLWKGMAFVGGLVLAMFCDPVHAAPSSGRDIVHGL